ncbi:MAG: hypothetical protein QJR07_08750 [Acetobacteraceae bacterium]|nr:hypothetical protein [Acetobacteraceae bacterium]
MALLPLAAAAADWTAALPALAPALRACLAGDAAAFATGAEPLPGNLVVVRVQRGKTVEDCLARASGEVVRRQARPDLPAAEAMAPAFFLDRRCVDARRVDGPGGRVLGWLAYPGC